MKISFEGGSAPARRNGGGNGMPYSQVDIRQAFAGCMFFEKGHRYKWNGRWLDSVTKVVKRYAQEFDAEYWAAYCSVRDSGEKVWPNKAERLVMTPGGGYRPEEITRELFPDLVMTPAEVREDWARLGREAAEHGTKVHSFAEGYMLGKVSAKPYRPLHEWFKKKPHYWPVSLEVVCANYAAGVAGQADALVWDEVSQEHVLLDYKTNKELKWVNRYDKMLPPFDGLDDCNGNHYRLQMSIYAKMLDLAGLPVDRLEIVHVPSTGEAVTSYLLEPVEVDFLFH